ncbi:MAG: hypothetical protein IPL20_07565 [Saprospiraceae bacterium]|nr:hypothetical protein [Saprospiraceae bacterium]
MANFSGFGFRNNVLFTGFGYNVKRISSFAKLPSFVEEDSRTTISFAGI